MMFTKLPIPTDDGVPDGYSLIVAYGKGDTVVVPIDPRGLADENHNCDWEGCSTMHHVVRFSVLHKYAAEECRTVRQAAPLCASCGYAPCSNSKQFEGTTITHCTQHYTIPAVREPK